MKNSKVQAIILSGDGINCESETKRAFSLADIHADIIHIQDLIGGAKKLSDYDILALPGGFSFGDEIKSGKILSLKIEQYLKDDFNEFYHAKKPIIGICNGFQALTYLGVFDPDQSQSVSLDENTSGKFINLWVDLDINSHSECIWTKGLDKLRLPIRHGEGRVSFSKDREVNLNKEAVLYYDQEINGSYKNIAGLTCKYGTTLGLMPHPEAGLYKMLDPKNSEFNFETTKALKLFKNAKEYVLSRKSL